MAKIAEVQEVSLTSLVPYERNAKIHGPEQIEKLKDSICEFGFLSPCLIDREYNVIAGHGRIQAAKELGMKTVPCVFIDGLTEAQRKAYILADNRLTEMGDWDMDLVQAELEAIDAEGIDISLTGFDWDTAAKLDTIEDDYTAEDAAAAGTRVQPGELWECGAHRLLCGDSTSVEDMDRLFSDGPAEMVFTDPPYGVAIGTKNKEINNVDPGRGGAHNNRHRRRHPGPGGAI